MRDNSGSGRAKNNNRNPTLKEHQRARGSAGEAIVGEQKKATGGKRKESRSESSPN